MNRASCPVSGTLASSIDKGHIAGFCVAVGDIGRAPLTLPTRTPATEVAAAAGATDDAHRTQMMRACLRVQRSDATSRLRQKDKDSEYFRRPPAFGRRHLTPCCHSSKRCWWWRGGKSNRCHWGLIHQIFSAGSRAAYGLVLRLHHNDHV